MSRVEKSKKFFGDLLPEDKFTEEAYQERHKASESENDKADSQIKNIIDSYKVDCPWK